MGLLEGYYSLGADVNKVGGKDTNNGDNLVGVVSPYLPELTLDIEDEKLIKLTEQWENEWDTSAIKSEWSKQAQDNNEYWKGKQFTLLQSSLKRAEVDNIIFEGTETFLPAATRQNPEPLVELRATEEKSDANLQYATLIRNQLADWADDTRLRLKIKKAGRHWFLSLVGLAKMGWDPINNFPAIKIVRAQKCIFDPKGITDEDGYQGKYLGEYRKMEASVLTEVLSKKPEVVSYITEVAKGDMGTDIQFIEWWTKEYLCWTLKKKVLLKIKNPHFNYKQDAKEAQGVEGEDGYTPAQAEQPVFNHFASPDIPYVFLTVFNLGKTPVDETSLITQVLPQQDTVNTRNKQISRNINSMNNGVVVSEERSGLDKDQATQVTAALNKGGTVVVPTGNAQEAVYRLPANPLPPDVFNNLVDNRNRFREILGITGLTPAGIKNEDTVRGKIITKGLDGDRIGGGVTEYFEQFADGIFNWALQLMYVYDDIFAQNQNAKVPKLKISVKEGSMLPKDATTKANQAIELAGAGKMSLVDLYKALEYPDPEKMAANVWLEANAPELLFKDDPRVQQVLQMRAQSASNQEKPVSESINFKDLPPGGQSQMAAKVGIKLDTEEIAAHNINQEAIKNASKVSTTPAVPVNVG